MYAISGVLAKMGLMRALGLAVVLSAVLVLPSCGGGTAKPVPPVSGWQAYRSAGGKFSMEVPSGWRITERGGAGHETTIRANANNWIVVSREMMPGELEAKYGSDPSTDAHNAVTRQYDRLKGRYEGFRGETPEVSRVGDAWAGRGAFTCQQKRGFGGGAVELQGATVVILGTENIHTLEAYADKQSQGVVGAAFDHMLNTFKLEE